MTNPKKKSESIKNQIKLNEDNNDTILKTEGHSETKVEYAPNQISLDLNNLESEVLQILRKLFEKVVQSSIVTQPVTQPGSDTVSRFSINAEQQKSLADYIQMNNALEGPNRIQQYRRL